MRTRTRQDHVDTVSRRLARLSAPARDPGDDDTVDIEVQPRVPVPGRHAARRERQLPIPPWWPEPLRGRVALNPWHLSAVSMVVIVGLVITGWWLVRGQATAPTTPVSASSVEPLVSPSASPELSPSTDDTGSKVTVDVSGTVRRPGMAVLPAGSRVVDAIEAAGGARKRGHLNDLNLAQELTDGQQVLVGPASTGAVESGASASPPSGSSVSINSATQQELETLPGVGPVTAQAILDHRSDHGPFAAVEELIEVSGIGEKTLADLVPLVTL